MFHNIPMTLQENKTFAIQAVAANLQILQMIPVHLVEDPSFLVAVFQEPTTMVRLMEGLTSTNAGCVVWYFSVLHYVSACPGFGSIERLRLSRTRMMMILCVWCFCVSGVFVCGVCAIGEGRARDSARCVLLFFVCLVCVCVF